MRILPWSDRETSCGNDVFQGKLQISSKSRGQYGQKQSTSQGKMKISGSRKIPSFIVLKSSKITRDVRSLFLGRSSGVYLCPSKKCRCVLTFHNPRDVLVYILKARWAQLCVYRFLFNRLAPYQPLCCEGRIFCIICYKSKPLKLQN